MKIVWVTRSFLDYRIPVFKALKGLNKGEFKVIFNEDYIPDDVVTKVKDLKVNDTSKDGLYKVGLTVIRVTNGYPEIVFNR